MPTETYRSVKDSSLEAVARAIQQKGGTTAALQFPAGFLAAIAAIDTQKPETALQVTPGDEAQVFNAPSGYTYGQVTVAAIPSNYGKISYNGGTIKVE